MVNAPFPLNPLASWARTAGDLWLCSWLGDLGTDSCFPVLRPGSTESLASENWAPLLLIQTGSKPADRAARLLAASRPPPSPAVQGQAPKILCDPAFANLPRFLGYFLAVPALFPKHSTYFSTSRPLSTLSSAWNVLWLPMLGSREQDLGELSSNPA